MTAAARSLRVLLVDDDDVTLLLHVGMLQHVGIDAVPVSSVAAALAELSHDPLPDVVLSDVEMPDRDGFELCRAVRDDPRLAHLPFVFVTGRGAREDRIRALDAGADDLLGKPVDDLELVARVRSLARLSRARLAAERTRQLNAVLDRVGGGIVVLDEEGAIEQANPPACALLQLPDPWTEVDLARHVADHFERVDGDALTTWERTGPRTASLRRTALGAGEELFLDVREEPLTDLNGRATGRLIVLHDTTDLQRSRRTSDVIIASINHKFRIPLSGIRGSWQLLDRMPLTGDAERLVALMGRSVDRLDHAVLRVLTYASRVAQHGAEERRALRHDTPLDELAELVHPGTEVARAPRWQVTVTDTLSVPVSVLEVAVAELVDNATSASDDGTVTVTVDDEGTSLVIHVDDEGAGIPPEDRERVLEDFFQVDRTGTAAGLGLGLSMAALVTQRAGGTLALADRPGGGTRATLTLPVEDRAEPGRVHRAVVGA